MGHHFFPFPFILRVLLSWYLALPIQILKLSEWCLYVWFIFTLIFSPRESFTWDVAHRLHRLPLGDFSRVAACWLEKAWCRGSPFLWGWACEALSAQSSQECLCDSWLNPSPPKKTCHQHKRAFIWVSLALPGLRQWQKFSPYRSVGRACLCYLGIRGIVSWGIFFLSRAAYMCSQVF